LQASSTVRRGMLDFGKSRLYTMNRLIVCAPVLEVEIYQTWLAQRR
jgi:hypothetical protein